MNDVVKDDEENGCGQVNASAIYGLEICVLAIFELETSLRETSELEIFLQVNDGQAIFLRVNDELVNVEQESV